MKDIKIGTQYSDPEGIWEIVEIDGDDIGVISVSSKAEFNGDVMGVTREEVEYFLTHDWQTGEVK